MNENEEVLKENISVQGNGQSVLMQCILDAKTPTKNENIELVKAAKNGDKDALENVVIRNGKLVLMILRRYTWLTEIKDDLLQEGLMGVQRAVEEFNFDYETAFSTYAVYWIRQYINQYITKNGQTVSLPNYMIDRMRKIKKIEDERNSLGLSPLTDKEIAEQLGITEEEVIATKINTQVMVSLDDKLSEDNEATLGESIASDEANIEFDIVNKDTLQNFSKIIQECLSEREYDIIKRRYGIGEYEDAQTFSEIGEVYNLSKQRICQIEERAIKKLRKPKMLQALKECDIM